MSGLASSESAMPRISYSRKMVGLSMYRFYLVADESVPGDHEPERPIRAVPDSDSGRDGHINVRLLVEAADLKRAGGEVGTVEFACDAQGQREFAGAGGE